ncbi:MAG: 1-(5-phosphoribosyl)-5-amino-4-imidazole-carboxylate carboxylase, partial [Actinobacteria bacterium]|nr:1-(5-phosphoribosyl)-5-amino-4-imidazole-carboxylate carboxylase [Actinomycetota bacterium]
MDPRTLQDLLDAVARGDVTAAEASERIAALPVRDLGFARVDTHREVRTGFAEVIYCPGKTPDHVRKIAKALLAHNDGAVLGTRATPEHFDAVKDLDAHYDEVGRTIVFRSAGGAPLGHIAVVCAGTSDLPVAQEAVTCAEAFGLKTMRITDVGVAG